MQVGKQCSVMVKVVFNVKGEVGVGGSFRDAVEENVGEGVDVGVDISVGIAVGVGVGVGVGFGLGFGSFLGVCFLPCLSLALLFLRPFLPTAFLSPPC